MFDENATPKQPMITRKVVFDPPPNPTYITPVTPGSNTSLGSPQIFQVAMCCAASLHVDPAEPVLFIGPFLRVETREIHGCGPEGAKTTRDLQRFTVDSDPDGTLLRGHCHPVGPAVVGQTHRKRCTGTGCCRNDL